MKRLRLPFLLCLLLVIGCARTTGPGRTPAVASSASRAPASARTRAHTPTPVIADVLRTRVTTPTPEGATATPSPSAAQTVVNGEMSLWWDTVESVNGLLPPGAKVFYGDIWEWEKLSDADTLTLVVPYRSPDGPMGLIVVAGERPAGGRQLKLAIRWDWQQETLGPRRWQDIQRPHQLPELGALCFLGLDEQGQWWAAVVGAEPLALQALLPVAEPVRAEIDQDWIPVENRPDYWVQDGDTLTLFGWSGERAIVHWSATYTDTRATVQRRQCDYTGDGRPDLVVAWDGPECTLFHIYQATDAEYERVAEVEPTYGQHTDIDGDRVPEFLWPEPTDAPANWRVYGWNGEQFAWRNPLARPWARRPARLDAASLPPLPLDLYLKGNRVWVWPHEGGALRQVTATAPATGCRADARDGLVQWSPNCRFAVLRQVADEVESYTVESADGRLRWPILDSWPQGRGYLTFAWSADGRSVVYAAADLPGSGAGPFREGLFRLNLDSGRVLRLASADDQQCSPPCSRPEPVGGAVDPAILPDGSIVFTMQWQNPAAYPPPGVYRLFPGGRPRLLANIPPLEVAEAAGEPARYGSLLVSPDGSMFIYRAPAAASAPAGTPGTLLLGLTDGSALWNLAPLAPSATAFWWQ